MTHLGYASAAYAASFEHSQEVIELPRSQVYLVKRPLHGGRFDLAGLYPLTMCDNWSALDDDVADLRERGAVSIVLVACPFSAPEARTALSGWTVSEHFKTHVIVRLDEDWSALRPKRVRDDARRSFRLQTIEVEPNPRDQAAVVWALYQHSIARHHIPESQQLSERAIASQLDVDGVILVVARAEGELVGAMVSYDMGEHAFLHFTAQSARGYELFTSYGLIHRSLEELQRRGCLRVSLGGSAGLRDDASDSLYRFKGRWSPHREKSLLCGNILDQAEYDSLVDCATPTHPTYFPRYRSPNR